MSEILSIKDLNKSFHIKEGEVKALDNINLNIKEGEFISLVGASGCGKSTLLRIITGLESQDNGEVLLDGKPLNKKENDIGMIFQESRLFPWLSVSDNVAFGIDEETKRKIGKKAVKEKIEKVLELVGLQQFSKALPSQLSGGMQQRVSIARSLIGNPRILLLDEPFAALDAFTRLQMQNEIQHIWKEEKRTMILVTHDIDEAIYLGDRAVVLSSRPGKIKKIIPVNLARPRERSSVEFIRLRERIYKEFFDEKHSEPEYII